MSAPQYLACVEQHSVAPAVCIVVVHWNNWLDTLECLQSLSQLDYANTRIVVVDNGSNTAAFEHLNDWCKSGPLGPAEFKSVTTGAAPPTSASIKAKLTIVRSNINLGYAGGVNLGIELSLLDPSIKYIWILNNDVIVQPDCLNRLVAKMIPMPSAGICGARLVYHHSPNQIQALGGGRYSPITGRSQMPGRFSDARQPVDEEKIERKTQFVVGASMFVARTFIEAVGLMDPTYLLYHEEVDWAIRAGKDWKLSYCHGAVVFHKHGAALRTGIHISTTNPSAAYHSAKSRMQLTRKYFPFCAPTVLAVALVRAARAYLLGYPLVASAMISGLGLAPKRTGRRWAIVTEE